MMTAFFIWRERAIYWIFLFLFTFLAPLRRSGRSVGGNRSSERQGGDGPGRELRQLELRARVLLRSPSRWLGSGGLRPERRPLSAASDYHLRSPLRAAYRRRQWPRPGEASPPPLRFFICEGFRFWSTLGSQVLSTLLDRSASPDVVNRDKQVRKRIKGRSLSFVLPNRLARSHSLSIYSYN